MLFSRRRLLTWGVACCALACGGPNSRLVTVHAGTGTGSVEFAVKNLTDTPINAVYLAQSSAIEAAGPGLDFYSPEGQQIWGADRLSNAALRPGVRIPIDVPTPGVWDVRAVDRDDRYQHIAGLKLAAGGRYILELYDSGWRAPK